MMQRTATELGVKGTVPSSNMQNNEPSTARQNNAEKENLINRNKTDFIQINKNQNQPGDHDYTDRNNNNTVQIGSFSQIDE